MNRTHARETARELLHIMPLLMRSLAAQLRSAGDLPAPAHFGLLIKLCEQPRTLTELAMLCGVSLPTMSNSISALAQRGMVRRTAPAKDRRIVIIEVTPAGRSTLERIRRAAEAHLAEVLAPLDAVSRRRLRAGLGVLHKVFANSPEVRISRRPGSARARD